MDDIDLDLYGPEPDGEEEEQSEEDEEDVEMEATAGANDIPMGDAEMSDAQSKAKTAMANPEGHSLQSTHWCLIYRTDGALEVKLFLVCLSHCARAHTKVLCPEY